MASCPVSSEIEDAKKRLSPVQQKSKIPVRRVTRLSNNNGNVSRSKDEVNIKQRILMNRVEKSQNISTTCEEDHTKELELLKKEHSEIEEEL